MLNVGGATSRNRSAARSSLPATAANCACSTSSPASTGPRTFGPDIAEEGGLPLRLERDLRARHLEVAGRQHDSGRKSSKDGLDSFWSSVRSRYSPRAKCSSVVTTGWPRPPISTVVIVKVSPSDGTIGRRGRGGCRAAPPSARPRPRRADGRRRGRRRGGAQVTRAFPCSAVERPRIRLDSAAAISWPTATLGGATAGVSPHATSKSMLTSKNSSEIDALPMISHRPGPLNVPDSWTDARLTPS